MTTLTFHEHEYWRAEGFPVEIICPEGIPRRIFEEMLDWLKEHVGPGCYLDRDCLNSIRRHGWNGTFEGYQTPPTWFATCEGDFGFQTQGQMMYFVMEWQGHSFRF